jgi:hypothetical protein
MATEYKYEAPPASPTSYLTTELNSLANNGAVLGAKIDNKADGENELFIALELYLAAQASARDSGAYVNAYLLASLDDTNFNYGSATPLIDPGTFLTCFTLDAATTARTIIRPRLLIPPFDFKILLENKTGQAFASSGSYLEYCLYSKELQ